MPEAMRGWGEASLKSWLDMMLLGEDLSDAILFVLMGVEKQVMSVSIARLWCCRWLAVFAGFKSPW